jgi:GT2 family glycosyltransferase
MSVDATVVIPTCGRPEKLAHGLRALCRQGLPPGVEFEVIVAIDGGDAGGGVASLPCPPRTRFLSLPRVGIGAARNAALRIAAGDILIITNDDTYPEPTWVAEHVEAHRRRRTPGMVTGLTRWRTWSDATVFDGLVAETSMIFFFDRMRAGESYGFRHFSGCNSSLPTSIARSVGGFDERLRPYGYEDLEFAYRVERAGHAGVYYHGAAANEHDHRLTWRDYCRREACLGRTAACLWAVNPDCFAAVFGRRDAAAMRGEFAQWLKLDRRDHGGVASELRSALRRPLASVAEWDHTKRLLYRLHLPVKRRCFRAGFVSHFDRRDDAHWRERLALGHSFP